MGKFLLILAAIALIGYGVWQRQTISDFFQNFLKSATINKSTMQLTSPVFTDKATLPAKYTCDGEGLNPPLSFTGLPGQTVSLALTVEDPDAPGGTFTHWVVFNIPATNTGIEENSIPDGAISGVNSTNDTGYVSPCPPSGTHHYIFTLYALDTVLKGDEHMTRQQLLTSMKNHILDQAQLTGLYKRQ